MIWQPICFQTASTRQKIFFPKEVKQSDIFFQEVQTAKRWNGDKFDPGTLGKLIKVNEASVWWQDSLLPSKKGKQRRERNDSESPCQEPDFIFSSLVHGRSPSISLNYIILLYCCPKAGLREHRNCLLQTFPAPTGCRLLTGRDEIGQSLTCHYQGRGTSSQISGLRTYWYLHTTCFLPGSLPE